MFLYRAILGESRTAQGLRARLLVPLAAVLLTLSACGEGGGILLTPGDDDDDDPPPAADCTDTTCGEVRIALTDADGDFLSYVVDVVSIRLERDDGDTVEALPERHRVDFVDLLDLSELVAAMDIPNGTYERVLVRLDYEDAEVSVEVDGLPAAAAVVDANADAPGEVTLDLRLDEANPLVVASDAPALLQLDFDLEGSHEVNLGTTPATVTAAPFLVASLEPVDTREFRVSGPLVSVNEGDGRYRVNLRPFNHATAEHGAISIETTTDTTCEVDGDVLDIDDCLAALADLPEDTPTSALGIYDVDAQTFTAERVLVAGSVPGAEFDTVIGTVSARNLDQLVVSGGTVMRTDGSVVYAQGDIEVALGLGTDVTRDDGSTLPFDMDDISVGQRIQAFGDASSSDFDPTLAASGGRVRLHRTRMTGTVVNAILGELRLNLFSIEGRDPQFFDFDGTGSSSITEANPQDYQVGTGSFDLGDFDVNDGAEVFGYVGPFRTAPPDFTSQTLVHADELRALLGIGWGFDGTEQPFVTMGENGFVIDTGNIDLGERQRLEIGPFVFDITSNLPAPIRIEPAADGPHLYALSRGVIVENFSDFGEFATRVNSLLRGGSNLRALTARGAFDVDTTTLEANYVAVAFVVP
ncbi:MAG TPA: DUF4382 domain-containing protein [Steroidobacteraceae bacterium]|nr:DUF4382 domain-containing protein [Steroidobacteraceae bacterium]